VKSIDEVSKKALHIEVGFKGEQPKKDKKISIRPKAKGLQSQPKKEKIPICIEKIML
jgi:hypothetical protein